MLDADQPCCGQHGTSYLLAAEGAMRWLPLNHGHQQRVERHAGQKRMWKECWNIVILDESGLRGLSVKPARSSTLGRCRAFGTVKAHSLQL